MANIRMKNFCREIYEQTPFVKLVVSMVLLWLLFSYGIYVSESGLVDSKINSFGTALYWGVAAFSTAGIADMPVSALGKLIGGIWIVLGSVIFFGAIVATVTAYFMRPMQRPDNQILEAIEYNLEQLDALSLEELDLLRETVDSLIEHMEKLKTLKHRRADDFPNHR